MNTSRLTTAHNTFKPEEQCPVTKIHNNNSTNNPEENFRENQVSFSDMSYEIYFNITKFMPIYENLTKASTGFYEIRKSNHYWSNKLKNNDQVKTMLAEGNSPQQIFRKHPEFRRMDEDMFCDDAGLKYLDEIGMCPITVKKMQEGKISLDEFKVRKIEVLEEIQIILDNNPNLDEHIIEAFNNDFVKMYLFNNIFTTQQVLDLSFDEYLIFNYEVIRKYIENGKLVPEQIQKLSHTHCEILRISHIYQKLFDTDKLTFEEFLRLTLIECRILEYPDTETFIFKTDITAKEAINIILIQLNTLYNKQIQELIKSGNLRDELFELYNSYSNNIFRFALYDSKVLMHVIDACSIDLDNIGEFINIAIQKYYESCAI